MKDNTSEVVNPNIKLTEKEQKNYSLSRAIMALNGSDRDGFEFDVSQEIGRKLGRDTAGFFMPTSVRSFAIGDSSTGGALTMTEPGEFIDYLRNRAQVAKLGASVMSLPSKVALPRLGGDIAATWVSEDGTGATISSASLAQVVLSPKKLIAYTGYSLETLRVANYSIDAIVTDNMYKSLTVAFDKAAIQGTGTTQPTGILNQTGLVSSSVFTSGSALTYAGAVDAWSKVAQSNADDGSLAYLTTPQVASQAATTIRAGSSLQFIMLDDKTIYGYPVAVSNNVPTLTGHYLIFGDWSALIMAEFGAIDVTVDPYTSKAKGLIEVSAALLGDVQFKQLSSFAILKGINA
jgi:HK97 family phage major capsid protein